MSTTFYDDDGGLYNSDYALTFYDNGYGSHAADLGAYSLYGGQLTWDNQVSSFYSTEYVTVFEGSFYSGDYATFSPGFHDLADLNAYGIENDDISSFV